MIPFASLLQGQVSGGVTPALVAHNSTQTLGTLGVRAGDIMYVSQAASSANAPVSAGGSWTLVIGAGGSGAATWQRTATAADLLAKLTPYQGADFYLAAYRGAANANVRYTGTFTGSAGGYGGFTKATTHAGLAVITVAPYGAVINVTGPASWTQRYAETGDTTTAPNMLFDRLYPANTLYKDNAVFTFTRSGGGSSAISYAIIEFVR